jgi:hypothetical protein
MHVRFMSLEQRPSKTLDLLHWAMRMVMYKRIAMAIETASKQVEGEFFVAVCLPVTLASAEAIQSEYSSNDGIQGHLVWRWICCIGRCCVHRFNASAWPSKWPAMEVHSLVAATF